MNKTISENYRSKFFRTPPHRNKGYTPTPKGLLLLLQHSINTKNTPSMASGKKYRSRFSTTVSPLGLLWINQSSPKATRSPASAKKGNCCAEGKVVK